MQLNNVGKSFLLVYRNDIKTVGMWGCSGSPSKCTCLFL